MPAEFRAKVKSHLEYMVEYKRQYKLEEEEVFAMLNEGLTLELIVNLNGRLLHSTQLFKNFDLQFLSELTFALRRDTFEDYIFAEGDEGTSIFFIIQGNVYLILKSS